MLSKCIALALIASNPSWYEEKLEGWYYFQENDAPIEYSSEEAREILEEEKQRLNALLASAIVSPTQEHLEEYMQAHDRWAEQSSLFAEAWQKTAQQKQLDFSEQKQFLLFCFNGKDPLSAAAAQSALALCEEQGWRLKALSLDGEGIEGIDFEIDRGLSRLLDIRSAPSLYLVDPSVPEAHYLGDGR